MKKPTHKILAQHIQSIEMNSMNMTMLWAKFYENQFTPADIQKIENALEQLTSLCRFAKNCCWTLKNETVNNEKNQ